MMLLQHFKHSLALMRQNRLYTTIYVMGTGLAIAFSMVLFITLAVRFLPISPEKSRNDLLVLSYLEYRDVEHQDGVYAAQFSSDFYTEVMPRLKHLSAVTAIRTDREAAVELENQNYLPITLKYAQPDFWKIFNFEFLAGGPYLEADEASLNRVAVISESLAKRLFATTQAVDKTVTINRSAYRVCGVVKDVSGFTPVTYANAWTPAWVKLHKWGFYANYKYYGMPGKFSYYMLPVEGKKEELRQEIADNLSMIKSSSKELEYNFLGQPDDYWYSTLRKMPSDFRNRHADEYWSSISRGPDTSLSPSIWDYFQEMVMLLLAFILIPAINLSGMIAGRMDYRLHELGVRRAFGASRGQLLSQVLWENFLLTLLGGLVGLILSYLIVLFGAHWIMGVNNHNVGVNSDHFFTPEMLFNPALFLVSFLICILLNFVSALIPALRTLRHSIIYALYITD